jgi:hypothetical protein
MSLPAQLQGLTSSIYDWNMVFCALRYIVAVAKGVKAGADSVRHSCVDILGERFTRTLTSDLPGRRIKVMYALLVVNERVFKRPAPDHVRRDDHWRDNILIFTWTWSLVCILLGSLPKIYPTLFYFDTAIAGKYLCKISTYIAWREH